MPRAWEIIHIKNAQIHNGIPMCSKYFKINAIVFHVCLTQQFLFDNVRRNLVLNCHPIDLGSVSSK